MDSRLKKPSFIFECFVEVSKPKEGQEAAVQYLFPKDYELTDDLRKQLPKFAFPTRTPNTREEHFAFVLTDLDSKYKFGFCRYPPRGETCMCFVSDLPWYKVFYRAMDKISDLKLDHQNEVVEPFLYGLREHPIPTPGIDTVLSVVPKGVDAGQVYTFPLPNPKRLKEIPTDGNLTQFYTNLHYNVIMHLFANMIFERRIIITSSNLSLLSCTVHGAVILLYPLHWQHIFIPITPPHLLDYCAAPMPFLMGIHSSYMDLVRRMPMDDVVILDVDESTIESPHVDDLLSLPPDVVSNLKHVLKKQSSAYGDTVTRAFLLAQVAMIGGYRSALKLRQGEKEVVFDEDQFLKSRPHLEDFLGQLLHFQHFRQFINGRIEKLKNRIPDRDLFDNEVLQYEEELKGTEQIKAAFDKFLSSTREGSKKLGDKFENFGDRLKKAKIVDKSWKSMKKGAKKIHGMMQQDQRYGYQDHPGLLYSGTYDTDKKSSSLPIHKSSSESVIRHSNSVTPPPAAQPKGTKPTRPPPVIPYNRHIEGKRKLAQSLKLQTTQSLPEVPVGMLLNFTPPETPRSVASADQTSLDRSERASLDSKASTEASVASGENASAPGEVAIGNLIDIAVVGEHKSEDEGHESDSAVSTTSSSGVNTDSTPARVWERFDDDDDSCTIDVTSPSNRPPIPPPRSALFSETSNSSNSLNPFETDLDSRPRSPFDDSFSSSVAQTLSEKANVEESLTARTLTSMSRDIFKIIEEEEVEIEIEMNGENEESRSEPLVRTSSPALVTTNMTTSQARNSPQASLTVGGVVQPIHNSASAPTLSTTTNNYGMHNNPFGGYSQQSATIAHNTNPFYTLDYRGVPLNNIGVRPSGPRSPKCERKWPQFKSSHEGTLVYVNNVAMKGGAKRAPPQKPQPYSGRMPIDQTTQQQLEHNKSELQALYSSDCSGGVNRREDKRSSDPTLQRLPSIGVFDPFGDILGEGGLQAYMNKEPSPIS